MLQSMPELPEVETVVRGLRSAGLGGRLVRHARINWPKLVAQPSPAAFAQRLRGQRIQAIQRRAKFIVMPLSGGETLINHLRMTGQLRLLPHDAPRGRHEHLGLTLDDGRELRFHDPRKFGRWWLTRNPEEVLGRLGPEPLSATFSIAEFSRRLRAHRRQLKPLLLDQTFLAGLGNIYVDEALWEARLHPQRRAHTLSATEQTSLYVAIRRVLRQGIRFGGTSLGDGEGNFRGIHRRSGRNRSRLQVYQRAGQPCSRCRTKIMRLTVAQRGTHLCPQCQKRRGTAC